MTYRLVKIFIILSVIYFCSCNQKETIVEFCLPSNTHSFLHYRIFNNNRYEILVNDSVNDFGFSKFRGDTIFLSSNRNPLYTNQKRYNFLLKKDSICKIEMIHLKKDSLVNDILNNTSDFEMKEQECFSVMNLHSCH